MAMFVDAMVTTEPGHPRTSSRRQKAIHQQYLTPQEEKALVDYVLRCADNGYPLPVKALRALAFVIRRRRRLQPHEPANNDSLRPPSKNYPSWLYKRHPELRARRLKAIDWVRADENIHEKIVHWFSVIGNELSNPEVVPENVYNMDETGVLLGHSATLKMLVRRSDMRTARGTPVKRVLVTGIECVSAAGNALFPLIIWPSATLRTRWTTHPTPGWHFACSPKGYNNSVINLYWIRHVFDPQTRDRTNGKPRILINDGFASHESAEIVQFCWENNIILCRLPSHTSHKLQPLDVAVFGALKTYYRDLVEGLYRGGAGTVGKQHFTQLYSQARDRALSRSNILAGWNKAGLFLFNPNRVLDTVPAPLRSSSHSESAPSCHPQESTVVNIASPVLITPVTSEGFAVLRQKIEREIGSLGTAEKALVEKALNAGQQLMAHRSLLQDENQRLVEQNLEKQVRISTVSRKVGTAKVMRYEDIVQAVVPHDQHTALQPAEQRTRNSGNGKGPNRVGGTNRDSRIAEADRARREVEQSEFCDHCHILDLGQR